MSTRSTFNEATRVQMPAMVHLTRLGYKYFGKISEESAGSTYDSDTNILLEVFKSSLKKLILIILKPLSMYYVKLDRNLITMI